ncbi:MAG: 4a-hydroxytetrahydrobiopterin dehydratase [Flavobacteriaceae bacterium]|nr:4a-hydroxytetrahydrobiopterin dehydratase [Flavobacteriaceae bacterium]
MKPFTELQILSGLKELDGWEYEENAIHTSFEFDDFKDAFSVMTRIAFEAERLNHHPDWCNVYNILQISLSTHDADGVTAKDFELAKIIDELVA